MKLNSSLIFAGKDHTHRAFYVYEELLALTIKKIKQKL